MSLSPTATLVDIPPPDPKSNLFTLPKGIDWPLDPSMSFPVIGDFPFLSEPKPAVAPFAFSSPPASDYSADNNVLNFDIEFYTHCSPASDLTFDQFGFASTPESITLISPKSTASVPTPLSAIPPFDDSVGLSSDPSAAEALSSHHLQRYYHYKALAAQAEAAACQQQQQDQFDAFLAYTMIGDDRTMQTQPAVNSEYVGGGMDQQVVQPQPFFGISAPVYPVPFDNGAAAQQQANAAAMHAQAQAHMQAHDAAMARAQQQRSMSMSYYQAPQRPAFETLPSNQAFWQRQSVSSSVSSPPFPSTPASVQNVALPAGQTSKAAISTSLPNMAIAPFAASSQSPSEGEQEMDDELESNDGSESADLSMLPPMPIANAHGGGRGYIPGKTPDDPKKKHKCNICGRGFARAFNLKSHVQTHNPLRSKPHQCPHPDCKRGFSRLHDLERHRQGIHSDGPLVDAKRHNVPPAVARAQNRIQRRAAVNGGLI